MCVSSSYTLQLSQPLVFNSCISESYNGIFPITVTAAGCKVAAIDVYINNIITNE